MPSLIHPSSSIWFFPLPQLVRFWFLLPFVHSILSWFLLFFLVHYLRLHVVPFFVLKLLLVISFCGCMVNSHRVFLMVFLGFSKLSCPGSCAVFVFISVSVIFVSLLGLGVFSYAAWCLLEKSWKGKCCMEQRKYRYREGRLCGRILKIRIELDFADVAENSSSCAGRSCSDNTLQLMVCLETYLHILNLQEAYSTVLLKKLFLTLKKIGLTNTTSPKVQWK